MAPPAEEENYFSDDDDDWNGITGEELEAAHNEALTRFTQVQATQKPKAESPTDYFDDDDDDLDEVTELPAPAPPTIQRVPVANLQNGVRTIQAPFRPQGGTQLSQRPIGLRGIAPTQGQSNPPFKRPVPIFGSTAGGWTPSQAAANKQYPPSSAIQNGASQRNGSSTEKATSPVVPADADVEALRKRLEEVGPGAARIIELLVLIPNSAATRKDSSCRGTPDKDWRSSQYPHSLRTR